MTHPVKVTLVIVIIALLLVTSPLLVSADHEEHDWTTGPGNPTEMDLHGLEPSEFITLWSGAENTEDTEFNEDAERGEPGEELTYDELYELAQVSDFSFSEYPEAVDTWNSGVEPKFAGMLSSSSRTAYVPEGVETYNSARIKDAYIAPFSIRPSARIKDGTENNARYVRENGEVVSVVDYRVEQEATTETGSTRTEWSHEESEILYHRLAESGCLSANNDCVIDEEEGDSVVQRLLFRNMDTGSHELQLEGEIETTWEAEVYICTEYEEVNDGDDDDSGSGGGQGDSGHTQPVASASEPSIELTSGTLSPAGSSSERDADCLEWTQTDTRTVTDTVTVENEVEFFVQEEVQADVHYARFPNGDGAVHLETDGIWTTAELPSEHDVTLDSGWSYYSIRNKQMDSIERYGRTGRQYHNVNPHTPLEVHVFPHESGVQVESSGVGTSHRQGVVYVNGPEIDGVDIDENVDVRYRDEPFNTPLDVVVRLPDFQPGEETVVHGTVPQSSTTASDSSVRQLHNTNVFTDVEQIDDTERYTVTIRLYNHEGRPIDLRNRDGVIRVNDETMETDENGEVTITMTKNELVTGVPVQYEPSEWWEVPDHQEAYLESGDVVSVTPNDFSISTIIFIILQFAAVLALPYIGLKYFGRVIGIDLTGPIKDYIQNFGKQ